MDAQDLCVGAESKERMIGEETTKTESESEFMRY